MNTETPIVSDTVLTDTQARFLLGNKLFKVMELGTVVTARKGQNLFNVKMDKVTKVITMKKSGELNLRIVV